MARLSRLAGNRGYRAHLVVLDGGVERRVAEHDDFGHGESRQGEESKGLGEHGAVELLCFFAWRPRQVEPTGFSAEWLPRPGPPRI